MPAITIPPADGYHFSMGGNQSCRGVFAFEFGGALYQFASGGPFATQGVPPSLHALKSTDNGATWALLDDGAAPLANTGDIPGFGCGYSVIRDGSTVWTISAKYDNGTVTWTPSAASFDLLTETWGAVVDYAAPIMYPVLGFHTQFALILRGPADYVLFYAGLPVGGLARSYYATFNGAAFGAPVAIPGQVAGNAYWPVSGVVDSAGTSHLLMWSGEFPHRAAYHISLLAGGLFGTLQTVLDTTLAYAVQFGQSILSNIKIITVAGNETVAFATCAELQANPNVVPIVLVSALVATDPVWGIAVVESAAPGVLLPDVGDNWPIWNPIDFGQTPAGTIYVAWTNTVFTGGPVDYIGEWWESHSADGLVWTPHTVLFNAGASPNPFGWVAEQTFVVNMAVGVGIFGVPGNANGDILGGPYWRDLFFLVGAPLPPPTLTVNKVTVPPADPGLFNLQIDGVTQAPNQGNGGTTGPIVVVAGPHQVGETAGVGTALIDYVTTYAGDAAPDGSIVLANGDNKVAVIINTRKVVPPPIVPGPVSQGGWRREVILIPNQFDKCLAEDLLVHRLAGQYRACCRDLIYYDIINVRAPAASIPFRKVAGIPTPLAASGDVVVLDFQVPPGYDGLIAGCFNVYTGPGFGEGGGDIEWRILINKVYAVQLGQILVTLGSQAQSYPFDGGIQIQSGQRIRYIVNCPNLSGGILPLNSQIVCGLEGLFYARQ